MAGIVQIGLALVIGALEAGKINQQFRWRDLAGKWGNRHLMSPRVKKEIEFSSGVGNDITDFARAEPAFAETG